MVDCHTRKNFKIDFKKKRLSFWHISLKENRLKIPLRKIAQKVGLTQNFQNFLIKTYHDNGLESHFGCPLSVSDTYMAT